MCLLLTELIIVIYFISRKKMINFLWYLATILSCEIKITRSYKKELEMFKPLTATNFSSQN